MRCLAVQQRPLDIVAKHCAAPVDAVDAVWPQVGSSWLVHPVFPNSGAVVLGALTVSLAALRVPSARRRSRFQPGHAILRGSFEAAASVSAELSQPNGPGDFWNATPRPYHFAGEHSRDLGGFVQVEQTGHVQKPGRAGSCEFYKLPRLANSEEVARILSACSAQNASYETGPDSVDRLPTFEYYPFSHGRWVDQRVRVALEDILEGRILPYVRERYGCPGCAVADVLVRRYVPGERRAHAVHFDGHAFATVILGLSDPDSYVGGFFLQPGPHVSSRLFPRIEPGDALVHSFDLPHGVHVWDGVRQSLIVWVKASPSAVRDGSAPWYDEPARAGNADALYHLARSYERGAFGRPKEDSEAMRLYERSASAGHHFAQNNLALLYKRTAATRQQSLRLLRAVADAGFALAQRNLADAYVDGRASDVWLAEDDLAEAIAWMRRAAVQLDAVAAYRLAQLLLRRWRCEGGLEDAEEAKLWLARSASVGVPAAQIALGLAMLGRGDFSPVVEEPLQVEGPETGEAWLRAAVAAGSVAAARDLAALLRDGVLGPDRVGDSTALLRDVLQTTVHQGAKDSGAGDALRKLRGRSAALELEEVRRAAEDGDASAEEFLTDLTASASARISSATREAALRAAACRAEEFGLAELAFQLCLDLSWCIFEGGMQEEAITLFQRLLEVADCTLDSQFRLERLALVQHGYAVSVLRARGSFEEAEELLLEAAANLENLWGLDHPAFAEVRRGISAVHTARGGFEQQA